MNQVAALESPIWMTNVACSGEEPRLAECPFSGFGLGSCSTRAQAGVTCFLQPPNATQGELRLMNAIHGDSYVHGLLQIFHDGEWGNVCDLGELGIGWPVATVACRQLGYSDKGK